MTRSRAFLLGCLVIAACLLAYGPAYSGKFLWDDEGHITKPELQSVGGLARIWTEVGATQQYYPLLHTAFWVEHRFFGDHPAGYHVANVVWHIAAAGLLLLVLRRLFFPGAEVVALLFLAHPMCVESVAWISEQKNTLSAVFYFGALLAYLSFDRSRKLSWYAAALALFIAALLTKTVTSTLVLVLIPLLWSRNGRVAFRRDLLPLIPLVIAGAIAAGITIVVERTFISARGPDFDLSIWQRLLLPGRTAFFYAGKLLWPGEFSFFYPRWNLQGVGLASVVSTLGFGLLTCAVVALRRGWPTLFVGWTCYVITLLPASGLFNVYPFRFSYVADHFAYLALPWLLLPVAGVINRLTANMSPRWRLLVPLIVVTTLFGLSWRQTRKYQDSETLYRETLKTNPAAWLAHANLGILLANDPAKLPEAIAHLETAVQLAPRAFEPRFALANARVRVGDDPGAISSFEAAIALAPGFAPIYNNLGCVYVRYPETLQQGIQAFRAAVRLDPNFAEAYTNLGSALMKVPGEEREAIAHLRQAIHLDPKRANSYFNLGNALARSPEGMADAVLAFETALRLDPSFEAHYNLGQVLLRLPNRLPDAERHFQAALRLRPDSKPAQDALRLVQLIRTPARE